MLPPPAPLVTPLSLLINQTIDYHHHLQCTMCKHILNAQVSLRSPCCKKWYDCITCHAESETHPLLQRFEVVFACKKCKKCFRKDTQEWDESDEYCPHCDNHFVIEAKVPRAVVEFEGEDVRRDARMVKDERVGRKGAGVKGWDVAEGADRLG
ncbi:hypothetical protein C7212DRAFT_350680 [Tuber magnatum]|uniref:CHY-type domain-containing protein n=1 Tax=Tuber magnatum TaxID=42249 RepID=A0A317SYP6_9PEZI|nr:hypothetical protein C7212DRAFT_350680 [Tuber magnatum]